MDGHGDMSDPNQMMAQTTCFYCSTPLQYPPNSMYIQCPKCQQTMNPQAPPTSYANCVGCGTLLSHPPSSVTIQCPKCYIIMDIPGRSPQTVDKQLQKKKRRDPNAPKRASNAYMVFCKENRQRLKEQRPDLPFGKIGATLGDMWRTMSAEEKKPYEDRATNDRDRYKREMVDYQSASMMKSRAFQQQSQQQPQPQQQPGPYGMSPTNNQPYISNNGSSSSSSSNLPPSNEGITDEPNAKRTKTEEDAAAAAAANAAAATEGHSQ